MHMVTTAATTPQAIPSTDYVQWMAPSPLWSSMAQKQPGQPNTLNAPALVRFTTDTFMEDLIALLQANPGALQQQIAVPESFQAPPVGASPGWQPPAPAQLKLYQPIHGFFYLVTASLVCHVPGLPDRVVNAAKSEKIGFVLRRLTPDNVEMAWVAGTAGGKSWQPLPGDGSSVMDGEEILPMSPLNFILNGRNRRLLIGLIPTSSRDTFQAAPTLSLLAPDTDENGVPVDPRLENLKTFVIEAIEYLDSYTAPALLQPKNGPPLKPPALEASQFILLDFAVFLSNNLPQVWSALNSQLALVSSDPSFALYTELMTDTIDGQTTWSKALLDAFAAQDKINNGEMALSYDLSKMGINISDQHNPLRSKLLVNVQAALGQYTPPATPPAQGQLSLIPKLDPRATTLYQLRCVYQRPQCEPYRPAVVSAPTQQFALAPFFDVDAPGRPIRIMLPLDTSIAGLRKFNKNVGFLISNTLRGQMERVTGLKDALDGKTGEAQQFDLGTICSFSIPIITICAMIVLMLFLILLNIVFWWLPFFRICLPIILPGKKSSAGGS